MVADVAMCLKRFEDADKDHRYMAVSDLLSEIQKPGWKLSSAGVDASTVCEKIVQRLDDASSDISALAVKCLVALSCCVPEAHAGPLFTMLAQKVVQPRKKGRNDDAACIGLKSVAAEVPVATGRVLAQQGVPVLLKGLPPQTTDVSVRQDSLDALLSVLTRFGENVAEPWQLVEALLAEVGCAEGAHQKKGLACIPAMAVHLSGDLIEKLMRTLLDALRAAPPASAGARTYTQALGSCAKALGFRFAPFVDAAVPVVVQHCEAADVEGTDAKEAALVALASMAHSCPDAVQGRRGDLVQLALRELSFDPNLAADPDGDVGMSTGGGGGGEDDDDDYDLGDYDDDGSLDEDLSWKVRRAAAALVIALIEAFPDAAGELYGACHAPLVRKFGEREESVKLDVLAAYGALVRANAAAAEGAMDSETSAAAAAADDTAALLKQAGGRSAALRTAVFAALRTLVEAFAGAGFFGLQAVPAAATALRDVGSANALKIEALRFLRAACVPAAMPDMGDALRDAAPGLAAAIGDKYYKVVVEALAVVEGAATMVARGGGAAREHAEVSLGLLDGVLARLKAGDQDQEVKEGAIRCAGAIVATTPPELGARLPDVTPLFLDKLQIEGTRLPAVRALGAVAAAGAPVDMAPSLPRLYETFTGLLRKEQRALRLDTLHTCAAVLARHPAEASAPLDQLLQEAAAMVTEADLMLAAAALSLAVAALQSAPSTSQLPVMAAFADAATRLACSTVLAGTARDSLKQFFVTLQAAAPAQAEALQQRLLQAGAAAPRPAQRGAAECVAAMCKSSPDAVAKTLRACVATMQQPETEEAQKCLTLLLLGELGRVADLSAHPDAERCIVAALAGAADEVKATASLALGGIAVGNLQQYLPLLLSRVQSMREQGGGSASQLYLLLKALNEVLRSLLARRETLSPGAAAGAEQQGQVMDLLRASADVDEECRGMVADCLAAMTVMQPGALFPELRKQLASESRDQRVAAVAAAQHLLSDSHPQIQQGLSRDFEAFVGGLQDGEVPVRREAIQLLSAAVTTRPALAEAALPHAVPALLKLTKVDPSLIKEVNLGPFKQKQDEGLTSRKYAFECLELLLSRRRFQERLDAAAVVGTLAPALQDRGMDNDRDVYKMCLAILAKACAKAPGAVIQHSDELLPALQRLLTIRPKEDAIPQEAERFKEQELWVLTAVQAMAAIPGITLSVVNFRPFMDRHVRNAAHGARYESLAPISAPK